MMCGSASENNHASSGLSSAAVNSNPSFNRQNDDISTQGASSHRISRTMSMGKKNKIIIITAVISIAPYLTDKGEYTTLNKINNNVCIKTSQTMNYTVIIMYSAHAHAHTHMEGMSQG